MDKPDRNHRATDERPKYSEAGGLRPDEKMARLLAAHRTVLAVVAWVLFVPWIPGGIAERARIPYTGLYLVVLDDGTLVP
jgi:hypothetical protein